MLERQKIGPLSDFKNPPSKVNINNQSYFLTESGGKYVLLSTVCPHQGGTVVLAKDCFRCPVHSWTFELSNGQSINSPSDHLYSYEVNIEGGELYAMLPAFMQLEQSRETLIESLSIKLHAHACLEVNFKGTSLLMDPWLDGPSFFGAWAHYPEPITSVDNIHPNAIFISHEHSDHFHPNTLRHFDRQIPIYVPDFPNRRIVMKLDNMGFSNVRAVPFGERVEIAEDLHITCFEPGSMWNDAIVLIEVPGFRFLNLNDAGINRRIAGMIGPVDAIASGFSPGASAYPITWTHITDDEKISIMERSRKGIIQMLRDACQAYQAKYVVPFASHFALWHPEHETYEKMVRKNTVFDVKRSFMNTDVKVIDLLPGDTWNVLDDKITYARNDRERLYGSEYKMQNLQQRFNSLEFNKAHPRSANLNRDTVISHFLRLNELPEMALCENLTFRINTLEGDVLDYRVENGEISYVDCLSDEPNLMIKLPVNILMAVTREDLSWDEAIIGYWCVFHRAPDVYHAGFWRLLQSSYYKKPATLTQPTYSINKDSVIADILEKFGEDADRIIRRYGLYCIGCHHSTNETLSIGGRIHGIDEKQVERLIIELNKTFMAETC